MSVEHETVLHKFISIDRQHHTLIEKQVSKGSLHRSQHRLLLYAFKCKEPPTQKEIANFFGISYAAVTVIISKLEASGHLKRVAQTDDMRSKRIVLTEKGIRTLEATKALVSEVDAYMFKDFSQEELDIFFKCLEKIQNNLSEFEKEEEE